MTEAKDDLKREKVRIVPISNIEDFLDHPFQVKDDESMDQLVESIRINGVSQATGTAGGHDFFRAEAFFDNLLGKVQLFF